MPVMDHTPASLFDAYEQDFVHLVESVKTKLDEIKDQRGEQRKAVLRRVEIELDEADDIISQLEVEIQGIPLSVRSPYNVRLKQAKTDLSRYKKQSKEVHSRNDLLGNASTRFNAVSSSDDPYSERARLLVGTETLEDGRRRIEESTRIAMETEAQGADILRDLRLQGETIRNTHETLQRADTSIGRASHTMKDMIWQNKKQSVILGALGAVLVLVILLILYFKFVR